MRVLRASITLVASLAAMPSHSAPTQNGSTPAASPATQCKRATSYVAGASSIYRGQPLKPQDLTQLPRAKVYMAIYRQVDGCEAPLTMGEYRNPRP